MFEDFIDNIRMGFGNSEEEDMEDEDMQDDRNVVSYGSGNRRGKETIRQVEPEGSEIIIMKPKAISEAKDIIDYLIDGNSVTINLESSEEKEKQRIMDMVSGYCYAFECNIEQVNPNVFVVSHKKIHME